jgi:hypothetical protein
MIIKSICWICSSHSDAGNFDRCRVRAPDDRTRPRVVAGAIARGARQLSDHARPRADRARFIGAAAE